MTNSKVIKFLDFLALALLIVGGLNWGLVGLFNFDLVSYVFGGIPELAKTIYIVVGVCALYAICYLLRHCARCKATV